MASPSIKSKKPRNKPPKSRPAATSALSQPAVEDASSSFTISSFSPQGELFAIVSLALDKHRLQVYDTITRQSIAQHIVTPARVSSLCWARFDTGSHLDHSPKRKRTRRSQDEASGDKTVPPPGIILGLNDGSLVLFSPAHGKVVKSISHPSSVAALISIVADDNADSAVTRVWTSGGDGVVRLWDLQQNHHIDHWKSNERIPYSCLAIRPIAPGSAADVTEILAANYTIQVVSANRLADLASGDAKQLHKHSTFTGHASSVKSLKWNSHSRFLSSAESDRFIYIWDVPETNGELISEGKVAASIPLDAEVRAMALSTHPDSSSLAKQQNLLALSASGRVSIFPLQLDFVVPGSSKSKAKIPTLVPKSSIVPHPKQGGQSRAQVVAATFVSEDSEKICVARLVGGVKPVFETLVSLVMYAPRIIHSDMNFQAIS